MRLGRAVRFGGPGLLSMLAVLSCDAPSVSSDAPFSPIATLPYNDGVANVAYGAGQYMVFSDFKGSRITPDGTSLDGPGFSTGPPRPGAYFSSAWRRLAFDGQRFVAVSASHAYAPAPGNLAVSRFQPNGTRLDTADLISEWQDIYFTVDLACGSGHCLAVGGNLQPSAVFFRSESLIASAGRIALPVPRMNSSSVAFDGQKYLVVLWSHEPNGDNPTLSTVRIDSAGAVVDAAPRPLRTFPSHQTGETALATNGTGYVAVYVDSGESHPVRLLAQPLDSAGLAAGPATRLFEGPGSSPAIESDGTNYLVLWATCPGHVCRVSSLVIDPRGRPLGAPRELGLAIVGNRELREGWPAPELAYSGTEYLATWADPLGVAIARRLDRAGVALDQRPVAYDEAPPHVSNPALAWTGCAYVGAYRTNSYQSLTTVIDASGQARSSVPTFAALPIPYDSLLELSRAGNTLLLHATGSSSNMMRRLTLSGTPLDLTEPTPIVDYSASVVTSNGASWLVAGSRYVGSWPDGHLELIAHSISESWEVGPVFPIQNLGGLTVRPSFAAAGSGYFGVWRDAGAGNAISGVALSASGRPLGAVVSVAGANASDVRPLVASNGSMYVAFWNEEERLLARGFGAAGTPITNTITVAERGNLESAVYDGRTFLVFHSVTDQSGRPAVVMQRLTPSLQLLSGAVTLDIRNVLAAASDGQGRTAIGYQRFDWTLGRRIITAPNAGPLPPLTCAGP